MELFDTPGGSVMRLREIHTIGVALAVLTLLAAGVLWSRSGDSARANAEQAKDAKLKELLKERHATLKEMAALLTKGHSQGTVPLERVQEAELAVLRAELDLCDTDKERL